MAPIENQNNRIYESIFQRNIENSDDREKKKNTVLYTEQQWIIHTYEEKKTLVSEEMKISK